MLHRVMYPEADEVDWRYKGQNKERLVRVLYLVDPNMDIKDLWQKYETMYEDEDDDKYGKTNLHTTIGISRHVNYLFYVT